MGDLGLEILTLPRLAARLAGGFIQPHDPDNLYAAIWAALDEGGFRELENVRILPGAARAVARTLEAAWRADLDLAARAAGSARVADLAQIEARVRDSLRPAILTPRDLRDAALEGVGRAAVLLGPVLLDGVLEVDSVWRPLVVALSDATDVSWEAPAGREAGWFAGCFVATPRIEPVVAAESCADPRSEVVEALRWARGLLAGGGVEARQLAICALEPEAWDQHILVLASNAGLPVHFTHGRPALDTAEGQTCAALADVLVNGLSQERVRRLVRRAGEFAGLPPDWARGIRRSAALLSLEQWRRAMQAARPERPSGETAEALLLPILELVAAGPQAAAEAGERLLTGGARALWRRALASGPPEALPLALSSLHLADPAPPETCICWGPASHLAASPRAYVRLLGLTSRGWPRSSREDPLLPDHILPQQALEPLDRGAADEDLFQVILGAATGGVVLSRSRRSAEGGVLPPSRLWPRSAREHLRTRIPDHAFSEADRLLARPAEAVGDPVLASGRLCWRNWNQPRLTVHDGEIPPAHSTVARTLESSQSATSLRRLLRDPLGYVWRYALGWRAPETAAGALSLDALTFGELTHELMRRAAHEHGQGAGLSGASQVELSAAVERAAGHVIADWPLARATPPPLLWRRTVEEASRLAVAGLSYSEDQAPGGTTWIEVEFGGVSPAPPWEVGGEVGFGGLRLRGRIDRLDLWEAEGGVLVTDFKTGQEPRNAQRTVLGGGAELQRVVYAAAARRLLSDVRRVRARLLYLRGEPSRYELADDTLEVAGVEAEQFVRLAAKLLRNGVSPSGPDAWDRFNDLRLALPADLAGYQARKGALLVDSAGGLRELWGHP